MAHAALIEAVRQKAAATIAAIWDDARREAARCRDDAERSIAQQREQYEQRLKRVAAAARQAATADAVCRSRVIRNTARTSVADRAHALAVAALGTLRDSSYHARFCALAEELPKRQWQRVTVNPADIALARRQFPGCEITTDAAICGGMIAEDAALRVTNTFERRLAASWPELLPGVMTDVLDAHQRSQSAA
jgi:vacuolar-type H+-ATPase subunit E/Vma4